ncbi:hypothetical protein LRS73_35550 (plasmid) [Methylobacterium currus]|uniref:hypothetical protein n=1 Tax=Methylobacterium currus TaxID=2051553 RepID=UPI001E2ED9F8|nr:hypothetical protein [Methylobacterium currus]UHC20449.1 hypothetical protein LRS73_35550 [Methylobacterium currus]
MSESLRRRAGFKKHLHTVWPGRKVEPNFQIVVAGGDGTPQWLADASAMVPEWRADVRDVYMRWAITINAMDVARERYAANQVLGLETRSLRTNRLGRTEFRVLDTWTALDTARNYELATPLLAAYGFADLYGLFEEIVFELYLIFLNGNPERLMRGDEFRELRRAHKNRNAGPAAAEEWEAAWADRLSKWRHKRGYDGLHNVFASLYRDSGLKRPSDYKLTDVSDWCKMIQAVGELRNLITHGVGDVSPKLAEYSMNIPSDVFSFTVGYTLKVDLMHLMFLESFLDQMLSAVSGSLLERAYGPVLSLSPE